MNFGLLGKSLSHSFSKDYFKKKFAELNLNHTYQNIELDDISQIIPFINSAGLRGFNVTIPYKESIIPYITHLDETVRELGAVNTVRVENDGSLSGFNTDVIGFEILLKEAVQNADIKNPALILGSGGASKAVQYVLKKNDISFEIATRNCMTNKDISYPELNQRGFKAFSLIINTTPVGIYPNVNEYLELPYSTITYRNIFIDLIYNPTETLFLKKARLKEAKTFNGLKMLYGQADASWEIWQKESDF